MDNILRRYNEARSWQRIEVILGRFFQHEALSRRVGGVVGARLRGGELGESSCCCRLHSGCTRSNLPSFSAMFLILKVLVVAGKASFFSPTTSHNVIGMVQQPHVASIALSHDEHSGKLALILHSYERLPSDMLPVYWPTN